MSLIVGLDGKTPIKSEAEKKKYEAGGLAFEASATPEELLIKALNQARQAVGMQAYQRSMQMVANAVVANSEANTAAMNVTDPFTLEPGALAVFMFLSRELEYRDAVIAQLNERLKSLGAEPIDVERSFASEEMAEITPSNEADDPPPKSDGESN